MGVSFRYLFEESLRREDALAQIVSHAITRIEVLKGKDSQCVADEYKEWLADDFDNDVMVFPKNLQNL